MEEGSSARRCRSKERAGSGIEIGDLVFRARRRSSRPFCLSCITVNQSELKREGTRNSFVSSFVSFLEDCEGLCEEGVCKGTGHEMGPHVGGVGKYVDFELTS